jgi:short-subunit dehydrogenase
VARLLGDRGVNVVLVARRRAVLETVAATIPSETRTLVLDLSTPQAAAELAEATADLPVGLFVYNAGADPNASQFLEKPVTVWSDMVARNCTTIVGTTHHFAALMRQRGHGGIVLVTSGAAWAGGSHLAVYAASKAFDLVLAESLWAELSPGGIDVLGMVLGRPIRRPFARCSTDVSWMGSPTPMTSHGTCWTTWKAARRSRPTPPRSAPSRVGRPSSS